MYSYKKLYWFQINILFLLFNIILSQNAFDGYVLFTPHRAVAEQNTDIFSYLEDVDGTIYNSWAHNHGPASMPYLHPGDENGFENTLLYYPCKVTQPTMDVGGTGGRVEIYNWEGYLLWYFEMANEIYQHHHDIEILPNGNILMILWERKYAEDWQAAGRVSVNNAGTLNEMWSTAIFEIKPNFDVDTSLENPSIQSEIVWEWHLWDHLIQDQYDFLSNYGSVADNPQLMDINCGTVGTDGMPGMPSNQHGAGGGGAMRTAKRKRPNKKKKGFGDL